LKISFKSDGRKLTAFMSGELDHHSAGSVREVIDKEIKRSNAINIIFDFRNLNFMDSSGIGVIIGRYKITKILGGETVIFSPTNSVGRIIEMAGLKKIIKIASSLENALMLL